MDKEEYDLRKKDLEKKYKKDVFALQKEFAFANNRVNIGDFVGDGSSIVKVDKIGVYLSGIDTPKCVYYGPRYTKKLAPFKSYERCAVYEVNMVPVA